VYINIIDEKRSELEPSSMKGIFVRYNESPKGYMIYLPSQRRIVVSQFVQFNEDAWSSKSQEPPRKVEEGE
jgi:hypothetical protein